MKEQEIAKICKALGDENRVKIIKLLSNGELCACKLLEEFKISQSTLSHQFLLTAIWWTSKKTENGCIIQ